MNLSQLQYFKVLAQEEHYTRAAQMLSITQPSLSHAISQLEQELGTRLFEKKGRNVVLTRYGKMFLPYVEESLKVLNEGVQRIQEVNGSRHGIIHLAYIYTMGSEFAPKLVRKFLDAYPDYDIEFHFTVGTTGEIIDGLKDDKYDIVFSSYLVAQGFGIAVMPDIPILRSLSVKTLDIYNPPYERAVYLATLKQRYLSPVAKAFIRFVIEETA